MKKWIGIMVSAALAASAAAYGGQTVAHADELAPACKAAYLCESKSGEVVYAKNETDRLPIASMCKIMTLLLSFEAVDGGVMTYEESVTVSGRAAGMGGSQVFLEANLSYPVEQLMKSVAVCSANDACVALAERVAGSEEAFVARMNERAAELGAENTLFANCTGLPKETQYSCAKDVSVMLRELIKHEDYFRFSRVWLEDFAHPDGRTTQMTNTNKLIRSYRGCDGGKTGFTNEAGFCLAATAERAGTRLISVAIGSPSSKERFACVTDLFDYAFANYETKTFLEKGKTLDEKACVRGGKQKEIAVGAEEDLSAFVKRGEGDGFTVGIELGELRAPIAAGEAVGKATLFRDGVEVSSTRLVAQQNADRYSWWDAYRENARNWN